MKLDTSITNEAGIYRILNTVTNKFYLGSAVNFKLRFRRHIYELKNSKHHSPYLQNSFNKYGIDAFKFEVLEVIPKEEFIDNKYLTDVEQMWLDACQPYVREIGYNIKSKADNSYGRKHKEETKAYFSSINKGRKRTLEQIEMSAAGIRNNYIFINPEGIEICIIDLPKYCAENNLSKIAMRHLDRGSQVSHKGWTTHKTRQEYLNQIENYPLPPYYVISPEGIEYEVFNVNEFSKTFGLMPGGLNRVIRNTRKQYKGWKLKYSG